LGVLAVRGLAAVTAMGLLLALGAPDLASWMAMGQGQRLMQLVLWILAGAAAYGTGLLIAGVRPRHIQGHGA